MHFFESGIYAPLSVTGARVSTIKHVDLFSLAIEGNGLQVTDYPAWGVASRVGVAVCLLQAMRQPSSNAPPTNRFFQLFLIYLLHSNFSQRHPLDYEGSAGIR